MNSQKRPPGPLYKKSCSQKFLNTHRKIPVLESLFNKTAGLIKKRHQHGYFPVNIAKYLRKPMLKNICERLLLKQ